MQMKISDADLLKIDKLKRLRRVAKENYSKQKRKQRRGKAITVKPEKWDKIVKEYEQEIEEIKNKYNGINRRLS